MRHFYRSHVTPAQALVVADRFFADLGLSQLSSTARTRNLSGTLGALKLSVRAEGGHYTFVEVVTDQMGESRMDRNVKKYFVELHRADDPAHTLEAAY
ncbi:MAG: hypothetical protein JWM95_268 [Gemmatimonadetes bacterium]|nr:hypothetical protein [Gemmatimonadota bacterium]